MIIIAVIGLIVLVIIIVLVQQKTTGFSKGLQNASESECPKDQIKPIGTTCDVIYARFTNVGPGDICCRKGTIK